MTQTKREKQRAYWRAWYERNKEKQREYGRAWRAANPTRCRAYEKKQRSKPAQARRKKYRERYGLSIGEYDAMFEAQNFSCAVCKDESIRDQTKRRHVDHCHTTGVVRGILCQGCNIALGHAGDDPARLRALASYLEQHMAKKSLEGKNLRLHGSIMTLEEYADYAITFLHLRGGPEPQVMNPWRIDGNPRIWGIKHSCKAWSSPQWDRLTPHWQQRVSSRREAALRYCWKHGLIRRHNKRGWTDQDLQNLRDPET